MARVWSGTSINASQYDSFYWTQEAISIYWENEQFTKWTVTCKWEKHFLSGATGSKVIAQTPIWGFQNHELLTTMPEKAMAPHSSPFAWKIPWVEEPGGLQSMGSLGVGYHWATSLWLFTFLHWRRKWQPTPVFLLGESQGRGSLVGCRLWGRTELDTTEVT